LTQSLDYSSVSYEQLRDLFNEQGFLLIELPPRKARVARRLLRPVQSMRDIESGAPYSKASLYLQMIAGIVSVLLDGLSRNSIFPILHFYILEKPVGWTLDQTPSGGYRLSFLGR